MNEYRYAEIKIGYEESFSVIVTQAMMDKLKSVTGDINPLHNDDDFVVLGGYNGRVVHRIIINRHINSR